MDTNTIAVIILFTAFMIFMILRVPVTFSMLGACVLTALYMGPKYASSVFLRFGDGVQSFSFLAIPFFIFAGDIMAAGGISDRLVKVADVLVGRFRGGLAYVNVIASTFFGGISGSPTADVSSLGPIEMNMMTGSGYDKDFTVAVTVATATQALIIPPSHNMIIYGMAAGGLSTGRLFLAGIVPGLLLCAAMCVLVARITKKRGYPRGPRYTFKESVRIICDGFLGVMTIVIILLGVCTGIFTTTESAAIACVYALFITLFVYRTVRPSDIWKIAKKSLGTLAMILSIIAAANAFCYLMSLMQVPAKITGFLLTVSDNKYVVLLLINLLLLVLGCFMDVAPMILIVTPILLPVTRALGMDPVHFGIMMMMNLAVGSLTPPVGTTLFAGCAVGDISIEKVSKALVPFYAVMVIALLLVTFIPAFSMVLPNLLMH
ncbi:MAG: TRAP transporter large permease [Lachnospiraceae bacterium]|nr:TRAP transporter large permease [Lachnospiraceae bacterium]